MENCGGPTPMDVGNMQHQQQNRQQRQQQDNEWQEEDGDAYRHPWNMWGYPQATPRSEEGPWQEEDVNGIQDAICHGCGGKGHIAPQCPSKGKGKGKGGKGGKGPYGPKGNGKVGYQKEDGP